MRNLSIVSRLKENAPETSGDLQASCTDLDEKAHYGASLMTANNTLAITIWKTSATVCKYNLARIYFSSGIYVDIRTTTRCRLHSGTQS